MNTKLMDAYRRLLDYFGAQHWWPADSRFEVIVGAVLTQNTSWTNVERALENLRQAGALSIDPVRHLSDQRLSELIRPAGYYRLKARRLRNLVDFIHERYGGSIDSMFATEISTLREELLSVNGIGPETADSILLYAGQFPTFVVDAYTARILKRHAWIEPEADYHEIKDFCETALPRDVSLFNEFHALIVQVGKQHCRKQPKCEECPLCDLLPDDGPVAL